MLVDPVLEGEHLDSEQVLRLLGRHPVRHVVVVRQCAAASGHVAHDVVEEPLVTAVAVVPRGHLQRLGPVIGPANGADVAEGADEPQVVGDGHAVVGHEPGLALGEEVEVPRAQRIRQQVVRGDRPVARAVLLRLPAALLGGEPVHAARMEAGHVEVVVLHPVVRGHPVASGVPVVAAGCGLHLHGCVCAGALVGVLPHHLADGLPVRGGEDRALLNQVPGEGHLDRAAAVGDLVALGEGRGPDRGRAFEHLGLSRIAGAVVCQACSGDHRGRGAELPAPSLRGSALDIGLGQPRRVAAVDHHAHGVGDAHVPAALEHGQERVHGHARAGQAAAAHVHVARALAAGIVHGAQLVAPGTGVASVGEHVVLVVERLHRGVDVEVAEQDHVRHGPARLGHLRAGLQR